MAEDINISTKIDLDYAKAQKKLDQLEARIDKLTKTKELTIEMEAPHLEQFEQLTYDLNEAKEILEQFKGDLSVAPSIVKEQEDRVKQLQKEWENAGKAIDRYTEQERKADIQIRQVEEDAKKVAGAMALTGKPQNAPSTRGASDDGVKKVNDRLKETTKESGTAASATEKFGHRIAGLAKRVFVFSLITQALRAVRSFMSGVLRTNDESKQALLQLRAALLTLIQPLVEYAIPVATKIVQVLTAIVSTLAQFVATLFGKQIKQTAASAQSLYDKMHGTDTAIQDATANAKKLNRQLAGFDELNVISSQDEASSSGGGGAAVTTPDFEYIGDGGIAPWLEDFSNKFMALLNGIKGFYDAYIAPIVSYIINTLIPTILNGLREIWQNHGERIKQIITEDIAPIIKWIVEEALPAIFDLVDDGMGSVLTWFDSTVGDFEDMIRFIAELIDGLFGMFSAQSGEYYGRLFFGALGKIGLGVIEMLAKALVEMLDLGGKLIIWIEQITGKDFGIETLGEQVIRDIDNAFAFKYSEIDTWVNEAKTTTVNSAKEAVDAIIDANEDVGKEVKNTRKVVKKTAENTIGDITSAIKNDDAWHSRAQSMKDDAQDVADTVVQAADKATSGIKKDAEAISSAVSVHGKRIDFTVDQTTGNATGKFTESTASIRNAVYQSGIPEAYKDQAQKSLSKYLNDVNWVSGGSTSANRIKDEFIKNGIPTAVATQAALAISGYINQNWGGAGTTSMNSVVNGMRSVDLYSAGVLMGQTVINGMTAKMSRIAYETSASQTTRNNRVLTEIKMIPMANGGLIPPNKEFLALLGDNKTEDEVVSPVSTMKNAVIEALNESGGGVGNAETNDLLRTLIRVLQAKEFTFTPSAGMGRAVKQSINLYQGVTG